MDRKKHLGCILALAVCLLVSGAQAANILYVGTSGASDSPPDYLADVEGALSHTISYEAAGALTAAGVSALPDSYDMVIIGSEVGSNNMDSHAEVAFRTLELPMLSMAVYNIDDLRWHDDVKTKKFLEDLGNPDVTIPDTSHPIWTGITPDAQDKVNLYIDPQGADPDSENLWSITSEPLEGDAVSQGATAYGQVILTWDTGDAMMEEYTAPARRVFFSMLRNSSYRDVQSLTADGKTAFANSVEWALVPEPTTMGLLALGGLAVLKRRRA
jgi:hypothetical protein